MAYYFMVAKKQGEYTPLDITKSKYFMRTSNLKGSGMTLSEADIFTMMFNNEIELRKALFDEGLIDYESFDKPLSIRNKKNNKYTKVMYDFLYQKDIEYVMDPKKIIDKINRKLLLHDYRFVLQFANAFLEFHDCASTAAEVRHYANDIVQYNYYSHHLMENDENGDNLLVRMAKLLIYEYYQAPSGRIEYHDTVKYRNLHAIIAFTDNYEKKYDVHTDEEQLSMFSPVTQKVKKRKKEKNITGQISLFEE